MNRDDVMKAIDDAFADGLKRAYDVLVSNIIGEDAEAGRKFERAVATNDQAHATASAAIEKIFGE